MPDDPAADEGRMRDGVATTARLSMLRAYLRAFPVWERIAVALIVILATFLDCLRLGSDGFGNAYYAAAVKSMLMSGHNLLFASFDPGGFVTVDKPPLGLWIQVVSAKLFSFTSSSLVLPQAIAGVLSVVVLYALVRRTFGGPAGLLAGFLLAVSPINVVTNRDNIMESLLVLTSLLAAGATLKAVKTGQVRWLAAAGALIGIGFNIKMLEAFLVVPACVLVYLACARGSWSVRWRHLILMGVVLVVVSLSWMVVVDATPASQRPYVDSTLANSELDLALNYNGLQRLVGQPGYGHKPKPPSVGTGQPGALRLFQPELGGQISWFLPLALMGLLASVWELSPHVLRSRQGSQPKPWTAKQSAFVFWVTWIVTAALFFSVGRFYNRYYLVMLAPALFALVGIGVVGMWCDYRYKGWRKWLLPAAVLATGSEQGVILAGYRSWNPWLLPAILLAAGIGTVLLLAPMFLQWTHDRAQPMLPVIPWRRYGSVMSGVVLATLIVAPLFWLAASFTAGNEGGFPVSGPVSESAVSTGVSSADPRLIAFLEAHAGHLPFLVATNTAGDAAPIILATGAPVMAMGGFSGYDPILTPARLARLVAGGQVRFFLLPSANLTAAQATALYPQSSASSADTGSFTSSYTNRLTQWVAQTCLPVPPQQWKTTVALGPTQLFDCGAQESP